MRAAVVREVGHLEIADVEVDGPRQGELLIRTTACGLCHSDLHAIDGAFRTRLPMVVGHEVAGIVEEVGGGVDGFAPGDQVVLTLSQFCGSCSACDRGEQWLCDRRERPPLVRTGGEPARVTVDGEAATQFLNIGGFAESVVVHQQAAVVVPPSVPAEVAAVLGCGVLTGFGTVVNVARVAPGESVAVVGCGGVGLAAVQAARIAGAATIVAIDRSPEALELASRLGATHVIDAGVADAVRQVRSITGQGADHAIEAIGLPVTMAQALEMIRPGGSTYFIGMSPVGTTLEIDTFKTVWLNRSIRGVLMGANRFRRDVPRLAHLYLSGALDIDSMITARLDLEDVPSGFGRMRTGAVGRSVAVMS